MAPRPSTRPSWKLPIVLVGPAALVGAAGAVGGLGDLGERLLLVADQVHRPLELLEGSRVHVARPAAEPVTGAQKADHEDLGDPQLAMRDERAGQQAAIRRPAQEDRHGDHEAPGDADHEAPERSPAQAASETNASTSMFTMTMAEYGPKYATAGTRPTFAASHSTLTTRVR